MTAALTENIGPYTRSFGVTEAVGESGSIGQIITIDAEDMAIVAGAETTYVTVDRGANDTQPANHAMGATVSAGTDKEAGGAGIWTAKGRIDFSTLTPPPAETSGSIITTQTTWVAFTTAGACGGKLLLENQSATGIFATWRMRARYNGAATASGAGGTSDGVTMAIDAAASAQHADYGSLFAVNAVAQPNALNQTTDATNIVTALYGRVDRTGTSVGRSWVTWIDTHAQTKAAASDYLLRISHNGTVASDGAITIYGGGRLPVLFNFEDATPGFLDLGAKTITFSATDGNHTISFT